MPLNERVSSDIIRMGYGHSVFYIGSRTSDIIIERTVTRRIKASQVADVQNESE